MKQIIYQREFDGRWRRKGLKGTAGIYGLADPRDMVIRYVGSSDCIEYRLYNHIHSTRPVARTPKAAWIEEMKQEGVFPVALLLQTGNFGLPQSEGRHQAESEWVLILQLTGGADLNVRLTPIEHPQSKASSGKRISVENRTLKETNKKLLAEIDVLKARIFTLEAEARASK